MPIDPYYLLFFAAFIPILILAFIALTFLKRKYTEKRILRFIVVEIVLISTRILLLVFNLGKFPELTMDPLFYALAMVIGFGFMYLYVVYIEEIPLMKFSWKRKPIWLQVLAGLAATIIMLGVSIGLLYALTDYKVSLQLFKSVDQILTAIFFAVGAIYEEWFFRGMLFTYEKWNDIQKILISALAFFIIHIGYLPFVGYGVYYLMMVLVSLLLGYLVHKFGIITSSTFHCIFVLISVLAV